MAETVTESPPWEEFKATADDGPWKDFQSEPIEKVEEPQDPIPDHPGVEGLSPEARRKKIYSDYLRSRQEDIAAAGGVPAAAMLPEAFQEQGQAAHAAIRPLMRGAPALGPAKPGGVREGIEEAATSLLASPFDPNVGIPMALTPLAPEVMVPYWAYQGVKDVPEAVAQTVTGETPSQKVQGGLRAAMDLLMLRGGVHESGKLGHLTAEELANLDRIQRAMPPQALEPPQAPLTLAEAQDIAARQALNPPGAIPPAPGALSPRTVFPPASVARIAARQKAKDEAQQHIDEAEGLPVVSAPAEALPAGEELAGQVTGKVSPEAEQALQDVLGQSKSESPTLLQLAEANKNKFQRPPTLEDLQISGGPKNEFAQYSLSKPNGTIIHVNDKERWVLEDRTTANGTRQQIWQLHEKVDGKWEPVNAGQVAVTQKADGTITASGDHGQLLRDTYTDSNGVRHSEPTIEGEPIPKQPTPIAEAGNKEAVAPPPEPESKPQGEASFPENVNRIQAGAQKTSKTLVPISQLSDQEIIALAKDAGVSVNESKFHLEHVRMPIITKLQELSDKGLLDRRAIEKPSPPAQAQAEKTRVVPLPVFSDAGIREPFLERAKQATTAEEKAKLQSEFNDAVKTAKAKNELERSRIALENTKMFMANPKAVIEQLEQQGTTFGLGEKLLQHGIATVTSKRFGKGSMVGKGTLAEGIISNYRVTAKIGDKTLTEEVGSRNNRRDIQENEALVVSNLARQITEQPQPPPPEVPGPQALGISPGAAAFHAITQKLSSLRSKLVNSWATRANKSEIAQRKDAADNQAKIYANQQGRSVLLEARKTFGAEAPQALRAAVAVIEAGGNRSRLAQFITQSTGRNVEAMRAAQFADANWDRMQPLADKIKAIHDAQITEENANGINTTYRENYIKHAFDVEKLPNRGEEFFGSGGGVGTRSGFKAARKFETIYDAIEAGYGDAIKSLDAAKLTESRLASGQQLINDRQWVKAFRTVADPTTGKPIIDDVTFDRNHFPIAPAGYDAVTVLPGQFVAVHNGYRGIFDAVTGGSKIANFEVSGLPVGQAAMSTAAGIKHGLLLFDTFHASRIMQKQFFLTGKVGWNKGLSLLEYTNADLAEAVRQGEITQEMADYARANRADAQLLLKHGLNVGRIQEALRNEVIRNLPVVGTFNKWVFDKVTRGAMMESALIELERVRQNNPGMSPAQAASTVAKNINTTFGNIGRQGIFKSRTLQDLSRLIALAPQWVESMARSEVGGFRDLAKVPVDLAMGKGLQIGTLGKTMAGGLLAYVIGTQLINLATRGQLTFQNKEEGHKLDAWIPDLTGKSPGFFLNPLSVVAELTHDAYRYAFNKETAFDVGKQMAENKASPIARSVGVLWSGKNFSGEKIDGSWNRIKEAGSALVPAPIPVSGFASSRPGQAQRQLTASLGVKTEPAPTALKRISDKAKVFTESQGKKPEVDIVYHMDSPHAALRNALAKQDDKAAMEAIQALRKVQSDAKIYQGWRQSLVRPFTGSQMMEAKFRRSLSPEDQELYDAAKKEKQETFKKFQALWAKRGTRTPVVSAR